MTTYTGGFTTPGTSAEINLVLDVSLVSQNTSANTSLVAWNFYMQEHVNANPYNLNPTSSATAVVGSTVFSSASLKYDFRTTNATVGIASGTITIPHNADGSKTISISASYNGGSPIGTASLGGSFALPRIPRNRARVGISGAWATAEVFAGINGAWVPVKPYVAVSGGWREVSPT